MIEQLRELVKQKRTHYGGYERQEIEAKVLALEAIVLADHSKEVAKIDAELDREEEQNAKRRLAEEKDRVDRQRANAEVAKQLSVVEIHGTELENSGATFDYSDKLKLHAPTDAHATEILIEELPLIKNILHHIGDLPDSRSDLDGFKREFRRKYMDGFPMELGIESKNGHHLYINVQFKPRL